MPGKREIRFICRCGRYSRCGRL